MKKGIVFLAAVLASSLLNAQTAKVVQLSAQDAAVAKSLHEQREALDKRIAELDALIAKRYLQDTKKDGLTFSLCTSGPCPTYKAGWSGSFEFSEDYKFIVPRTYSPPIAVPWSYCPSTYGSVVPTAATFDATPISK